MIEQITLHAEVLRFSLSADPEVHWMKSHSALLAFTQFDWNTPCWEKYC